MEVAVTVAKVAVAVCSNCNNGNGKVTKQRSICEKLIGIGSVMENYVGCDSSCNSYNIGYTELAPVHQCNVDMYSEYSHTCLWKRTCMTSFVLPSCGSGVLLETKVY